MLKERATEGAMEAERIGLRSLLRSIEEVVLLRASEVAIFGIEQRLFYGLQMKILFGCEQK